ncbi:MAG: urate hydroxylase PuuD [Xanthomonadales bacterium]|nr:urate hydroxylase PuuD [Xanthomonadales bacterium]
MDGYLQDWLSLLLRWSHVITGIAWIGASFYFNWLENHLQRQQREEGIAGDLWAVHGGGFYHLKKYAVAPPALPPTLHWFKWEAYATWLTGFALLVVTYYWDARAFMLDPARADIGPALAISIGLASMALSWLWYDVLCRSPLGQRNLLSAALIGGWFLLLAWLLTRFLGGRAAYIHVGAAIGTVIVANVFRVIIPAQKELVAALQAQRPPDPRPGAEALQRSRHNNYFTLPVLFIMISSHYPGTYGHPQAWLVLALLSAAGVAIRHYFNIRHLPGNRLWPLATGLLILAVLFFAGRPERAPGMAPGTERIGIGAAFAIVQRRCASCHAAEPANEAFTGAPLGIELDTISKLRRHAERAYQATVVTRTMPLGNLTGMTEAERHEFARWFEQGEQGD